ncbi:MAG: sugar phosphate isomerase/epimerase family protein [Suilimivivens sp.]
MQLGIRLHDTKNLPLEERLTEVNKQGFSCVHLALSKVIKENSVAPQALTPGYAMYLKRLFWEKKLDIAVLGCYLNLANPDPDKLKEIVEKYEAHIRFAALLGCGVVGTETGAPNVEYKYEPACHSEEALELFIKNLRPVVEYAEKMGVIFAIEPVWKHIVYNPARARRVLDEIHSPNLQIILDPVNLLDISNYEHQVEIVEEAVDLLGRDVAVVHIKDYVVKDGKLDSVAAGTGNMDYTAIMKFIKERKPYIHTTLENTVPENAVQAKEYIQKLWEEA